MVESSSLNGRLPEAFLLNRLNHLPSGLEVVTFAGDVKGDGGRPSLVVVSMKPVREVVDIMVVVDDDGDAIIEGDRFVFILSDVGCPDSSGLVILPGLDDDGYTEFVRGALV